MVKILDGDYPEHLYYDVENQIWYEILADMKVRTGFTPFAASFMGEVLVFTPKRIGLEFEKGRSFATIEGGKWVGSARAAFEGFVEAQNEALIKKPELLTEDSFGKGWMLIVRPAHKDWQSDLVTGSGIEAAFGRWLSSESYKNRTS